MTRKGLKSTAAGVAALVLTAAAASAQTISEEHIQELIRVAAERAGVSRITGAGTAATAQGARAGGTDVALTLDDAIKLALDRNLDIAVQRLNPQTFDYSIAGLRATYRPTLTSTVGRTAATNPSVQTIQGFTAGVGIAQGTNTYNGGVSQNLPWGGGSLSVALNNNRQTTSSLTALFNPAYNTSWGALLTQPLLRNFGIDTTRQQLVVTKLNQDVSEIQLQQTIINTVSNVRNAYWDYVFAVQSVDVAKRSVALAEQLVKDNQTRVEVGTMAPIDVVQAQAQAATQRQNLATAEGTRRSAELGLKRLIVGGTDDPNWGVTLDPVDRADFNPQPIDVPAALRRALDSRTDLAAVKKSVQMNDVTLKYLKNQLLPQADLQVRYGLTGQGGLQYITSGTGINRNIIGEIPGGFSDALRSMFGRSYPTWNVALNITYPVGTSTADANVARARVQLSQVEAQIHQIELQIATDVTNAAVGVESSVERVQAAQAARELAQRQLEAEQSKFEVGMSTNYFVVQAQRDLATAQNNELQAILAYRKSLVELERLQQTSLTSASITLISGATAAPTTTTTRTTTGATGTGGTSGFQQ